MFVAAVQGIIEVFSKQVLIFCATDVSLVRLPRTACWAHQCVQHAFQLTLTLQNITAQNRKRNISYIIQIVAATITTTTKYVRILCLAVQHIPAYLHTVKRGVCVRAQTNCAQPTQSPQLLSVLLASPTHHSPHIIKNMLCLWFSGRKCFCFCLLFFTA